MSEAERRGEFFTYDKFEKLVEDFDLNGDKQIELEEIPEDMMIFTRPDADYSVRTDWEARRLFRHG